MELPNPESLTLPGHDSGLGRSRLETTWPTHPTGFHDRCRKSRDSDIRVPTNHHAERDCSSLGHHHTPESRYDDAIIREQSHPLGSTKTADIPRRRLGEIGMLFQTNHQAKPSQSQRDCASQLSFALFTLFSLHSSPVHHPRLLRSTQDW